MGKSIRENEVKPILVFNPYKKLIGIFSSKSAAAKALGTSKVNVHYACCGKCISCVGLYFRELAQNIEVTFDDFNVLKLEDYDDLCGVHRRYYVTSDMTANGKKTTLKLYYED